MPVTAVETVRDSAKASTRADLVQALIEFALQSDITAVRLSAEGGVDRVFVAKG